MRVKGSSSNATWTFMEMQHVGFPDPYACFSCGKVFAEGDRLVLIVADRAATEPGVRRMSLQLACASCPSDAT